jgi:hypothetical protein
MMPQGLRVFLKGVSVRRSEGKGGIVRLARKCARPVGCFRRREDRLGAPAHANPFSPPSNRHHDADPYE